MEKEDEFDAYFRRATERAPIKQLSQQYDSVSAVPPTTARQRRASLQAPDVMYSMQAAAASKRSSPMTSRNASPSQEACETRTPTSPHRHSVRRHSRKPQTDGVERLPASPSSSTPMSTTTSRLARNVDQRHSTGSPARRQRRSQLMSYVSSPTTASTHRSGSRSPPTGPTAPRHGRRATLAGDLLQIPPSFGDCEESERRSTSVSPPSTSREASPTARRQRASRRAVELWELERKTQSPAFGCREENNPLGGREGHVIRAFVLSAKGVVNVGNTVRGEKVLFDDDAVEVAAGRAERPTTLRHASPQHRSSPTPNAHSPRRSPQRAAICSDIYVDQPSRKWRSEQPESAEYKVLVVGDHGVGKTELIRQFTSSYVVDSMSAGQHTAAHRH